MFGSLIEECVGWSDAAIDEAVRVNELAVRELMARRAVLVAVAEQRGVFGADGHRSMAGYLRATCNTANATVVRDRRLGRLLSEQPVVGEALLAGRISVDAAVEIARIESNPRIAVLLGTVVAVFVELAEHTSHRELRDQVDAFIGLVDDDGAFADVDASVAGRSARVVDVGGGLVVAGSGGDPMLAARVVAVFESFVEGEYRADVETRRAQHGDDAEQHRLPRTPAQRRFDALVAIFSAAAASPQGRGLPEPTVNITIDHASMHDVFAAAGVVLPGGGRVVLDDDGDIAEVLSGGLVDELTDDPEAFLGRRCETSTGARIHPSVVLQALLTAHVRRVVIDSRGVVVDMGVRQRLFAGPARDAAMLLAARCEHPGCELPARWSQIDHNLEWSTHGGRTDQTNANIECGPHNRFKHHHRWRTRRDPRGRAYTIRADGTIILPAGEHPPDLTTDEMHEHARARIAALTRTLAPADHTT